MGSPCLGAWLRFAADVDFSLPDEGSLLVELPLGWLAFGLERCLEKFPVCCVSLRACADWPLLIYLSALLALPSADS